MAGDCPELAESSKQNGTVPLSKAVLLDAPSGRWLVKAAIRQSFPLPEWYSQAFGTKLAEMTVLASAQSELAWRRRAAVVIMRPPSCVNSTVRACGRSNHVAPRFCHWISCIALVLACSVAARGDDAGQELLDKATDTKLAAENVADLNEVIKLCQDAIKAGLDEGNTKFANELAGQHAYAAGRAGLSRAVRAARHPRSRPQARADGPGRSGTDPQDRCRARRGPVPDRPAVRALGRVGQGAQGARRGRATDG